ncbi:hypothetical protein HPC49_38750 [Pyxidicoccus fallax]|uniref:Uncharacterized protein n=2 Tax=Pyxidicoccus fallax TaxID=394095 RepID=A0A848M0F9_9BACT|nr:hypothetical protein [Pyxidicoccus fallax]NMO23341.1 hypothetical protein [Pyxidicoccus fallax]NPC84138.1 hypothetical protein [Pyxidicoccus fallax]
MPASAGAQAPSSYPSPSYAQPRQPAYSQEPAAPPAPTPASPPQGTQPAAPNYPPQNAYPPAQQPPQNAYPPAQQPQGAYPPPAQQPSTYPPAQQPQGAYPPAQQPQNAYPPAQPADPAYPPAQQPSTYPPAQQPQNTYPPAQPADPAYPPAQQPQGAYPPAQQPQNGYPPAQQPSTYPPATAQQPPAQGTNPTATDAPRVPPEPDSLVTQPQAPLTPDGQTDPLKPASTTASAAPPGEDTGVLLDGRPRQGPFLSGPGSLTFIIHHTTMGALGGLFTQSFKKDYSFKKASREEVLAGTLIGAGLGFGASAWWQFNNWVDKPMAHFSIGNSVVGGMFMAGFMDLFTQDPSVLTWSAFLGAELGAWLTAGLGGGQLPLNDGLLVSSGAGWGMAYAALLLAVIHFSGTDVSSKTWRDTLLLAPGIGAGALALATMRYDPTPSQILRADIFGAGVGAAVLLISGLVLGGFDQSTPYVLSFLGSAGAITTVSLLWEESVDRSAMRMTSGRSAKGRPYKNVWW